MVLHVYNHINQKQTLLRNGVVFLEMWDQKKKPPNILNEFFI